MAKVIGVELSHQDAPVHIREHVALDKPDILEALKELSQLVYEAFIVSTCNRLAIYAYHEDHEPLIAYFNRFGNLRPYLTILDHEYSVAEHLFSTAAGLKSQALGEHQILGQVRESYYTAQEAGTLGPVLHELGKRAIRTGKRVRGETAIGQTPVSLSSVAFDLIEQQYTNLSDARIMVIGTGEMASLLLKILSKHNPGKVLVASRSRQRAEEITRLYNAEPIVYEEIIPSLQDVEVVVGASNAEEPILSKEMLESTDLRHPLTLIDLAVPRNFSMDLSQLHTFSVYDLDRLKDLTQRGLKNRKQEIPHANAIIKEEVEAYEEWLNTNRLNPVIANFYQNLEQIKQEELAWARPKLGTLDNQQERILEKMAHRILRKVSNDPIHTLKSYSKEPDEHKNEISTFQEIFNLKDVYINIPKKRIIVGTRGSKLAMAQTNMVLQQLRQVAPDYEFVTKPIKTSGDRGNTATVGAFVKEVELALLDGEIDIAVHSYKDLPTKLPEGLEITGVPPRGDVRDVLISRDNVKLKDLPKGSIVGTSSLRRAIQIYHTNPDLKIKPINGNINTRMGKIDSHEVDAICIAAIGLQRINMFDRASQLFNYSEMVPAVAQGVLAVETRDNDADIKKLVSQINDPGTIRATQAERTVLVALGGGCQLPLGAHARVNGDQITIDGIFGKEDGSALNREQVRGHVDEAENLGKILVDKIGHF